MKHFSKVSILVCTHSHMGLHNQSCGRSLSLNLVSQLKEKIIEQNLDISVREQACFGRCDEAIVARIYPNKEFFMHLTEHSLAELIEMAKCCVENEKT